MADNADKISQFCVVTGVEEERARFYLESSAWQLDVAVASFFENDGGAERQAADGQSREEPAVASPAEPDPPSDESSDEDYQPKAKGRSGRIADLDSSDSGSSDEDGQAFYVGGSETSGQQVLGPRRRDKRAGGGSKVGDMVGDMFRSAREHGAEVVEPGPSSSSKRRAAFKGTGYRLGQNENDTTVVPGAREPEPPRSVTLKLWKTGFSIDEGAIRDYKDPGNKEFLEYIKRGEIPPELIRESRGKEVHLQMEDHRTEEFISKKTRFQAFHGQGQMLGSPAPTVATAAPTESSAASASAGDSPAANEQRATAQLNLIDSEPVTSVQIRLADGSRLIGRFNHTHTVGQLRQYLITARPQYSRQNFVLMTTYPPRELSDAQATLKDASLLNATIMQRIK